MASTINAITTGAGGIVTSGDSSGDISLQSNGSTVLATTSTGVAVTGVLSASGRLNLPTWTTGTRPSSPSTGTTGYNTTTAQIEVYNATYATWSNAGTSGITYTATYVVVAGGGAGGISTNAGGCGGGGAGGYITGTTTLNGNSTYTVTV